MTLQRLFAILAAVLVVSTGCGSSRDQLDAAPNEAVPAEEQEEHGHAHDEEPARDLVTPTGPPARVPAAANPAVRGAFGQQPTVKVPNAPAPSTLSRRVLRQGDGRSIEPGDVILAHTYGITWGNKRVFENSYPAGRPIGFSIGLGNVIAGWDEGLVGVPGGSRVLLIVPPDKAYGAEGHPDAEVSPSETLVYVIDVFGVHAPDATADGTPVPVPAGLPTVEADAEGHPELRMPPTPPPADLRSAVLRRGTGPVVRPGSLLAVQYTGSTWRDSVTFTSTWERGAPVPVQVGEDPFKGEVAKALVGVPVGSRVLISVPPALGYGDEGLPEAGVRPDDTIVYLVDVLGEYGVHEVQAPVLEDDHEHGAEGH